MARAAAADQVFHPALTAAPGAAAPLAGARLTDRQRLAVLLEGAALLSLLEHAGWWLPRGWERARVAAGGRLALPAEEAAPGRSPRPAQEQLRELLLRLFGAGTTSPDRVAPPSCEPGEGAAATAPGSALLAGRGEARRAARELLNEWWQALVPLPADEAVAQIVAAAPFLWMQSFAAARRSLAGELSGPAGRRLWVAGPSASRARLLAACGGPAELAARLAGTDARTRWEGTAPPPAGGPPEAAASESARLRLAAASAGLGRFAAALGVLAPCRTPAARLLRSRCQLQLGRLGAARATLRRLEALPLQPAVAIEAAEVAVQVFANSGEPDRVPRWVRRARAAARTAPSSEQARSFLVAAMAAWDREEPAAMDAPLEAARAALFDAAGGPAGADASLASSSSASGSRSSSSSYIQALWRWHHARGLRAMNLAQGAAVIEHVGLALRCGRRSLSRHEAAGLWNDLGIGRVQSGDLARAERAFLHAQRLLARCDGPRRATLALHNLAEVRLRRGRTAGVREILAQSTAENRRGGNLRGLSQDTELWARLELVLGHPEQAAALCRAAIARLERRRSRWRREVLAVLLARALGWLQLPAEAAGELALATGEAVKELEPEERPALWAHAGDRAAALRCAAELRSPVAALWQAVLSGAAVPAESWEALAGLEPYRAARLVFDLERTGDGKPLAPAAWRRSAIATLRQLGAASMADWLEAREQGPWQALAAYAARPPGDLAALAALVRQAGDPDAGLCWVPAGEIRETPASGGLPFALSGLSPGSSGSSPAAVLLAADLAGGRLELRGRRLDPALAACFALAARDLALGVPQRAAAAAARPLIAPRPAASVAAPASPLGPAPPAPAAAIG
ncbi:MAG: hypothetical protein JOZ15_11390, partial [Acidobacteria bacterium]|nr:hypothetical protein [Acidobacteriota bacterium]